MVNKKQLSSLSYDRAMHSMCAVGEDIIVVTGSLISQSRRKAEIYRISDNEWLDLPDI